MEILAITFALALTIVLPSDRPSVSQLAAGIEALWRPEVFLLLQALWVIVFIMFGKSGNRSADILSSSRRPNLTDVSIRLDSISGFENQTWDE